MMSLAEASSYFDRTQVLDAFTGETLFFGQIDPYDDSKRDAMVAYRRVLSVAPGTVIPAHRSIRVFGTVWLVAGEAEIDGLEEAHRVKYVLQAASGILNIGTLSEFLGGAPAASVYGFAGWVKDAKQIEESSDIANMYEILLPRATVVLPQQVLWNGAEVYLSMSVRTLPSEYVGVSAVRLEQTEPLEAEITSRVYAPAQGAYVTGPTDYPYALRARWLSLFKYDAQLAARYQEGDFVLALPEETAINTSSRVVFNEENHSVLSVTVLPGGVAAHLRRV